MTPESKKVWADRLQYGGMFLVFFFLYFRFRGPAVNPAQATFRLGVLALGVVLIVTGFVLRARRG